MRRQRTIVANTHDTANCNFLNKKPKIGSRLGERTEERKNSDWRFCKKPWSPGHKCGEFQKEKKKENDVHFKKLLVDSDVGEDGFTQMLPWARTLTSWSVGKMLLLKKNNYNLT